MQSSSSSPTPIPTPTSVAAASIADNNNNSIYQRNKQLLERFVGGIRSDVTRKGVLDYIHVYMRFHHLYEGESQEEGENNNNNNHLVYRYDLLIGDGKVQTIENMIIDFMLYKKKEGLGAAGIDNYINHLKNFYWVNGVKGIDWKLLKKYRPDTSKKMEDREYTEEEVIAIEEKLDVRGKVVSGVMRGSGVRVGAVQSISIGDLFPIQTKYGKIYKIMVDRSSSAVYTTACIPEVAKRIDDYFEYRMRFGEVCRLYGKSDHVHEYHDGYDTIEKRYKMDELHLDPGAPLIREDFDRDDPFSVKYPRRISKEQIADIIRDAAVASGKRGVNRGQRHKRHRVMATHGFRKLFKKRCRRIKVDSIILERFLGHKSGNPKDGITKMMMTYDPEEWAEMQVEFEKAIPTLTITKDAVIQTKLEEAEAKLKNVPTIEQLQAQLEAKQQEQEEGFKKMQEEIASLRETNLMAFLRLKGEADIRDSEELERRRRENEEATEMVTFPGSFRLAPPNKINQEKEKKNLIY